jgi:hypothetical protein
LNIFLKISKEKKLIFFYLTFFPRVKHVFLLSKKKIKYLKIIIIKQRMKSFILLFLICLFSCQLLYIVDKHNPMCPKSYLMKAAYVDPTTNDLYYYAKTDEVRAFSAPLETSAVLRHLNHYQVIQIIATETYQGTDGNIYGRVVQGRAPVNSYVKLSDITECRFYCELSDAAPDITDGANVIVLNGTYVGPFNIITNDVSITALGEVILVGGHLADKCVMWVGSSVPSKSDRNGITISGFIFDTTCAFKGICLRNYPLNTSISNKFIDTGQGDC